MPTFRPEQHAFPLLLEVAVPAPLRRVFHYIAPEGFPADTRPGCLLRVPFGNTHVNGVLIGFSDSTDTPRDKLRRADRLLAAEPTIAEAILDLCLWAADYYHHAIGDVFAAAIPAQLRRGAPPKASEQRLQLTALGKRFDIAGLSRAPQQTRGLTLLAAAPDGCTRSQLKLGSISAATIRSLIGKGLTEWKALPLLTEDFRLANVDHQNIVPTAEQIAATNAIAAPGPYLLHGVTGSGKTEVYLRVIERVLKQNRQALVLVPEIGLTPQTVKRFSDRFDVPIALIHSGLTDAARLAAWQSARSGAAGIVIGTRSAIFTPLARPGLIIIDEEHDASFKQQDGFKYSARDLAVFRGRLEDVPVLLGSATPSLESIYNAQSGKYRQLQLSHRPVGVATENYRIISLRNRPSDDGLSKPLVKLIDQHLSAQGQVLVFLNRRGFAPVLLCGECHWMASCTRCDARMTYHLQEHKLVCHHCTREIPFPTHCGQCNSDQLVMLGLGTERLEDRLKSLFPGTRVLRIDRDSTRHKGSMGRLLEEIATGDKAILVGTQMLAKGHHFANLTLSVIVDIDSGFYSTDFKAIERMGQLILQVGGRAGRSDRPGTVVLQTHFPDQPALKQLIDQGYAAFAEGLLTERRNNNLPPFCFQALIRAESTSRMLAKQFLEDVTRGRAPLPHVDLLGPIASGMEKRADRYRALLLLASNSRQALHQEISARIDIAEGLSLSRKVRWSVDVDPADLF